MKKKIALFASGNGTNVQRICEYLKDNSEMEPVLIVSDNENAYVLKRAENLGIDALWISRKQLQDENFTRSVFEKYKIDFVVLAGFLRLIPSYLVQAFEKRMLNIHPALLPKYGGKGMYGDHVHKAVMATKEQESGITIHYVSEKYDEGDIVFQATCPVLEDDSPEDLARRIHALEYAHYPPQIELCVRQNCR